MQENCCNVRRVRIIPITLNHKKFANYGIFAFLICMTNLAVYLKTKSSQPDSLDKSMQWLAPTSTNCGVAKITYPEGQRYNEDYNWTSQNLEAVNGCIIDNLKSGRSFTARYDYYDGGFRRSGGVVQLYKEERYYLEFNTNTCSGEKWMTNPIIHPCTKVVWIEKSYNSPRRIWCDDSWCKD